MTAFMLGVRRHHIGLVHFLLKQYANGKYAKELVLAVNEYAGNETAFMLTAKLGFETILSLILSCCQKGMPLEDLDIWTDLLNARNTEEKSAIMLACQYNRVEIVRLLLHFGRGRYKLRLLEQEDIQKRTLLEIARTYEAEGVLKLLQNLDVP